MFSDIGILISGTPFSLGLCDDRAGFAGSVGDHYRIVGRRGCIHEVRPRFNSEETNKS